ncbi:MAG: tRNA-splicing endonuclease [Candidatus Diapherotrites archaeon ADurb.Bin253]|jgi:tRNA-intron endonuclease|nr:tRNA-intron lyase [Candidatus Pacearchaeota archaeon]OQA68235.1 MAG: tRNA-splicing endonuclease [Candidatus Diapherotrites archaeon ADurb.Bin253]HNZ52302.1 tRNA-intron lyase [Candidatus Pacearchaeota archaeon]HOC96718.1 tRNA-intron lyase [Candidatus Pacearchaeota archaeon]HOH04358.1 tRNA-intron lyase [Candidatus Pacearchaeota archaeon]
MKKITAYLVGEIVSTNEAEAFTLYKKSNFGQPTGQKVNYSLPETLYLVEKNKIEIKKNKKSISFEELFRIFKKIDNRIQLKYPVFKDLRNKGYVVKTALKFGSDFRVYEKGKTPDEEHAKWIVFCEHESKKFSWHEFSAKNRVAHSTKKNLLIAIIDEESDVSYYEISWIKT